MKSKNCLKNFFRRLVTDFKQKELIPLKMVFFVHSSTLLILYPYLTIHMRELGINVEETAIMSALTPVVAVLMPPIAGLFADRIGNFKILLALFSGIGGVVALLLLLVPVGRVAIPYPEQLILSLQCSNDNSGQFDFTIAEGESCSEIPSSFVTDGSLEVQNANTPLTFTNITITVHSCGLLCNVEDKEFFNGAQDIQEIGSLMSNVTGYTVQLINSSTTHKYNITGKDFETPGYIIDPNMDVRYLRKQKKFKNYQNTVQSFSSNEYFFPASNLFGFTCDLNQKNGDNCSVRQFNQNETMFPYKKFILSKLDPVYRDSNPKEIERFYYRASSNGVTDFAICFQKNSTASVLLLRADHNANKEVIELKRCEPRCIVITARKHVCKNRYQVVEFNVKYTFVSYLTVRLLIGVVGGTAFAMFEGAVIAVLRENNADYGLQRIYASIGGMISSPLSGFLIDRFSRGKGYTDFRPAFYFYALLKIITCGLMLRINLECKTPAKKVVTDVLNVLKQAEVVALYFVAFILGTAWGYIESFLFWLLQDLGASRSLMGITITVGGIAGIPLLALSGPIIARIGHANVLFIGFIFYAIRLVGYSMITAPWQCLIFEAMESVTSSLAFTAAVTYAAKLSSNTTDSSIQGMLGAIYFGVGKGMGSLVGGYLIKYVGSRNTYRIFAAVTLLTGIGYFLLNKYYISKHPSVTKDVKERRKSSAKSVAVDTEHGLPKLANGNILGDVIVNQNAQGEVNEAYEDKDEDEDDERDVREKLPTVMDGSETVEMG